MGQLATRKRSCGGFSTLEILVAMTVLVLSIVAVLLMQPMTSADTQAEHEALDLAQSWIENEQALARKDFDLVVPTTTSETIDSLTYTTRVAVVTLPDDLTKQIVATVSWSAAYARSQNVSLTALVTNIDGATSAHTCSSVLGGDWQHPLLQNPTQALASLVGDSAGAYAVTDVDAYHGYLYVTALTTAPTNNTFSILTLPHSGDPQVAGSVDTTGPTVSSGAAAVAVATAAGATYAFVANAYGANFTTCTARANCSQLQVVNVTNPAVPTVVANYKIPPAQVTGSAGAAAGNSIFYANGYVYLGLTKTTTGPEFNIIDVHDPLHPQWVGGYQVGYAVNAILVSGAYAYVAHPTDSSAATPEQVTVLDVSDPAHPTRVSGYHAPDNQGNGKRLYLLGDTLLLGRTVSGFTHNNDVYWLDDTEPTLLSVHNPNTPQPPGEKVSSSVAGLLVRDFLEFVLTGTSGTPGNLLVFDITNPLAPAPYASVPLPHASSGTALDCEGNTLIVGSNDASNKGYITLIHP